MHAAEEIQSRSPQDPSDVVATAAAAEPRAVHAAAERARQAQREWWHAGAAQRASALNLLAEKLHQRRDEATRLMVREVGKPVAEAAAEAERAISITRFYAQAAFAPVGELMPPSTAGKLWTERRPIGVAGLVTPWNFPLAIPLWKAAPALAMGNAVLLKPSPEAFATALWLGRLAAEVFPDGLFQVLAGGSSTGAAVVEAADVVSFTGSESVGRQVVLAAARGGTPVQAEMGGQNAAIVLPDADAERVGPLLAGAAMGYAGQKCTATRRVVVVGGPRRVAQVSAALVSAVEGLGVGDPALDGTSVGPVITPQSQGRLAEGARAVRTSGGRLLTGEGPTPSTGWYVAPVVADGLEASHHLVQEELFGPFTAVLPARGVAEAVRVADSVRFGLVTSVHGRDAGPLLEVVSQVGTGMVKVNAPTTGVDFYAPFGGEGRSSYGPREQGRAALDFYSSVRTVTFAPHP
ncbi:aldehyde dehydrogenase family protein [Ornithinicoccus halotolerans]|uniref:aldehyde dehydrogenase family protein n=1 Tax=Ornithinicoccus halotolerans TaxID=1748220 RepID=UPI001294DC9C|nr:aldehyde dehydrogenase family protein [Ornithinicoccus halotolerans]